MNKEKLLHDLFQAYYDARESKRNTANQLDFEFNLESNLIELYHELLSWEYKVWRSIYFIQDHPVKREIFAWNFRDRVIHHLIYNYISPVFEKSFIYDSYSCRKGKGTSFWIKRLKRFIRSCSANHTLDCYVLKLDISGYFMSINKDILFAKIKYALIWKIDNYDFLIDIIEKVVFNDPTKNGIFKGKRADYLGLPKNKSLFFTKQGCGLPIWNLTSQLFSNIYLAGFDRFIKQHLAIKYYGRYVDDFVIVHPDKDYLASLVPIIDWYLKESLDLGLHPKKIYLQHYSKWVLFLWAVIKPYRTYIKKQTIGYFYSKIMILNRRLEEETYRPSSALKNDFLSIINSYLGFLRHYKSYRIRKKILLNNVSAHYWNYFYISSKYRIVKRK